MGMPALALTIGDPGGIGPEVLLKSLRDLLPGKACRYVLIGSREIFEETARQLSLPLPFTTVTKNSIHAATPDSLSVLDAATIKPSEIKRGQVAKENAVLAMASLKLAAELAVKGDIQGIVTAPVNKTSMRLVDPGFIGHTEFLAQASGTKSYAMTFVGSRLVVTLVTIHVALSEVSKLLTPELVAGKIRLTQQFLQEYRGKDHVKIAVCCLNPHGKETGPEDERVIHPAVVQCRAEGITAEGPFSADQIFHDAYEGRYDAVVSMYHDQGLAPFKMISFRDGVNVTAGLPFVRTSPDHGTAFNIAGQDKADASSMGASIRLAERLIHSRLAAKALH